MRRYFQSLWFRLIFGLVLGSLAAVLAASLFLYIRFKTVNFESRERTLQSQAKLIAELYQSSPRHQFKLPESVVSYYRDGIGEFAVLWADGTLVAASPGVTHGLHPVDADASREFFAHPQPEGKPASYGISTRIRGSSPPAWVQVVFKDNEVIFDSVLEEFMQDIAWIWLPFVGILLVINLIVIRISLRPLSRASAQASAIGPSAVSKRLSEAGMPEEVLNFVRAINRALDRLEYGYKEQQAFIADAAHELRTPVAIMTTHMDLLPNFNGKAALKEELGSLKRLVSQLLDNARIDALRIAPSDQVDLNTLAADVAAYLAPCAISLGKTIEVYKSERPALVNGVYDFLFRALRNLIENGVAHTPAGSAVYIGVMNPATLIVADCGPGIPRAERQAIFERFWQGNRDRGSGAGLGMAIISRTVTAHGGKIEIGDRRGGGALFKVTFPPFGTKRAPTRHIAASQRVQPARALPSPRHSKSAGN
ncbi:MAG: sensor histidine kinase [Rhodomicrobium sp.]